VRLHHSGLSMMAAQNQSFARIYAVVLGQSSAIAYVDVYWLIAVGAAVMFVLAFWLKKNELHKSDAVVAH
jgi:ABC-type Mn2+/Zn2+ transport system permease subunit